MQNEFDRSEFDPAADPLDELLRSAQWPDDGTDPLDRLLRMAAWPEPAAGPLRHGLKKRSWVWAIGSIAAAAVFVISLTAWSMRGSGRSSSEGVATTVGRDAIPRPAASDDVAADRDSPPTHEQKTSPKTEGSRETVLAINSPVLERALPPGELYRRMFWARIRAPAVSDDGDWVAQLLAQRIADPSGNPEERIEPLVHDRAECERRLLERFHTFAGERESAAVELLGCVGSEASVPLLLRLTRKATTHVQAVRALLKIADSNMLARLALKEWDPDLREEITAALRMRGDKHTLALVLAAEGERLCLGTGSDL